MLKEVGGDTCLGAPARKKVGWKKNSHGHPTWPRAEASPNQVRTMPLKGNDNREMEDGRGKHGGRWIWPWKVIMFCF